jgi:hypothetical protein
MQQKCAFPWNWINSKNFHLHSAEPSWLFQDILYKSFIFVSKDLVLWKKLC